MSVSNDLVKHLRQITGNSISLCKKVLDESGGDMEKALILLRKSSDALAVKKEGRTTGAGIIETYLHGNKKIGVLLDIRCETDFVARNNEFQSLAHDIALHIAGARPLYINKDDIPSDVREEAERLFMDESQNLGKSPDMTKKIVEGKLKAHFRDTSLLSQSFVKDPNITIEELITRGITHFGEKIEIERFTRFEI
ncbi:MAG: elongation factor Ts [Patescibacteria group bacterium]